MYFVEKNERFVEIFVQNVQIVYTYSLYEAEKCFWTLAAEARRLLAISYNTDDDNDAAKISVLFSVLPKNRFLVLDLAM